MSIPVDNKFYIFLFSVKVLTRSNLSRSCYDFIIPRIRAVSSTLHICLPYQRKNLIVSNSYQLMFSDPLHPTTYPATHYLFCSKFSRQLTRHIYNTHLVAIPLHLARIFNAIRSPNNISQAFPVGFKRFSFGLTRQPNWLNTSSKKGMRLRFEKLMFIRLISHPGNENNMNYTVYTFTVKFG